MPEKSEQSLVEAVREYTISHINGRRAVPTREITEYLIEEGFISEDFLEEAPKLAVDAKVRKVQRSLLDQQLGLPEMENIKSLNPETGEITQGYRPTRLCSRDELLQLVQRDIQSCVILGHRIKGRAKLARDKFGEAIQLPLWVDMMPDDPIPSTDDDHPDDED